MDEEVNLGGIGVFNWRVRRCSLFCAGNTYGFYECEQSVSGNLE